MGKKLSETKKRVEIRRKLTGLEDRIKERSSTRKKYKENYQTVKTTELEAEKCTTKKLHSLFLKNFLKF